MSFSGEKVGYPTQKNESLVRRIVQASSSPGDIVLDCCAGSGTTAAVAEKLGRRWIASDASPIAVHAARKRVLALPAPTPFAVEMAGRARAARTLRTLSMKVAVHGRRCTLELASFSVPTQELPADVLRQVAHWSQWIEDWCVDWNHRGKAMHVGARAWRSRGRGAPLPLSLAHSYDRPGRYVALVRAYDVLGGWTTKKVPVTIR
jgi:hypothetical protein